MMNWTAQDVSKLKELAFAEKSNVEIAEAIGVPIAEIYAKRSSLGLTISKVRTIKSGEEADPVKARPATLDAKKNTLTPRQQLACAAYHLACFSYFDRLGGAIDSVLPCEICEHIASCDLNWWENQRILYQLSDVSISDQFIKQAILKKAQTGFAK